MVKFYLFIAITGIAFASISSESPRFGQLKRRSGLKLTNTRKTFARQEQIPQATNSAPYPPAGVTPEIPFDLPSETEAPLFEPDETYGPPEPSPDQTYLPPQLTPDQTYGAPAIHDNSEIEPDNSYSPPANSNQNNIDYPEAEEIPPSENLVSEFILQPRKTLRERARLALLRFRI